MMKKLFFYAGIFLGLVPGLFLGLSCAASRPIEEEPPAFIAPAETPSVPVPVPEDAEPLPEKPAAMPEELFGPRNFPGFVFIHDPVLSLAIPPGVGNVTRESRDFASALDSGEKAVLTNAFRAAYADGLLEDQSLRGVLGGDLVNAWPAREPLSWVQNWESSLPEPNSWGLPSLVLAIHDRELHKDREQGRVFTVLGDILDFYGQGFGVNGANGNAGFGSPRSKEFFAENSLVQRFDEGLIVIDENGSGSFVPEIPPSTEREIPAELGVFSGDQAGEEARAAFTAAWKIALDSANGSVPLVPDGRGRYFSFSDGPAWEIPLEGLVNGIYLQTFDENTAALILIDTPALPFYARFLGPPFLEILTSPLPLAGAENLAPLSAGFDDSGGFVRALMEGLALYGLPLTDPVYRRAGDEISPGISQRFTRGWIQTGKNP